MENSILVTENLKAWYGDNEVIHGISMSFPQNHVIAIMGPSGCGKSTFIRCLNRIHELTPSSKTEGRIRLDDESIYSIPAIMLRRRIGMVFQKPNPFPTMSIFDNVLAGYKLNNIKLSSDEKDEIVENALRNTGLWEEVKDSLHQRGNFLSGGQQQRLCIARTIAMKPEVLLLDEPTSSLDPISAGKIEDLIVDLKDNYTIVIVTHNMQQAGRVSDKTAFFYLGRLIEYGKTDQIFTNPKHSKTQNYITGRFS
ncbi:MAG TPA: phosphate ABC transporter ATP-binding protein PstB [Balneolaceae bacterium]|nr:phosphate ABC transporter ATP-binding protein PstB [Balneolaceae bacterium]